MSLSRGITRVVILLCMSTTTVVQKSSVKAPKQGLLPMRALVDDVRTAFEEENDVNIYIPELLKD
jgi:hypothetical protein